MQIFGSQFVRFLSDVLIHARSVCACRAFREQPPIMIALGLGGIEEAR